MENSWCLEFVKTLAIFMAGIIGGVLGGIWAGVSAEKRSRKNRHLIEFASAVRFELQELDKKVRNIDRLTYEWHLGSVDRLDQHANYMKDYDKRKWKKVIESYKDYISQYNDWENYRNHYTLKIGFPMEFLRKRLNKLLYEIDNA